MIVFSYTDDCWIFGKVFMKANIDFPSIIHKVHLVPRVNPLPIHYIHILQFHLKMTPFFIRIVHV